MLEFRTPSIDDKERIDAFVAKSGRVGCDANSVNTFLWRDRYDIRIAFTDDSYFKCYSTDGIVTGYSMPITYSDYRTAIALIKEDAAARGVEPLLGLLSDRNVGLMHRLYKDNVAITADRDSFDYIYDRRDLASLPGKKYHAKRNHIARFYRQYDDVVVEEICDKNAQDVLTIAKKWQGDAPDNGEMAAIRDALKYFYRLKLFGLLLYVNEQPVAFTIASRINDEMCDVHFEKAVDIEEAYAVINNEFAKHYDSYNYINREEDLGLEGLRKSKLSYHPSALLSKYNAVFVN